MNLLETSKPISAAGPLRGRNMPAFSMDIALRLLCALCYTYFACGALATFMARRELTVLLLLIAESLTVLLIVTARIPKYANRSLYASAITVAASFYFVFVDLSSGIQLIPVTLGTALQVSGISFQIISKAFLARSFGLLPANRGIITGGPYRLVRHPIYLGYFLNHIGFLLSMWSPYNFLVYATLYGLQFLRIRAEEQLLLQDRDYQNYANAVRWRFLPFLV